MKNIYLLQLNQAPWDFLTVLWPSAKTYYEKHGQKIDRYNWINPKCELYTELDDIKASILNNPPDIFGVSLYVWNYERSLELCQWVKETWPHCLVVTGGPQQFFRHNQDWFQKYSFIDASLPGEVYGELAICDMLDNLTDDNSIDWNTVEQIVYPTASKKLILQSKKQTYKRNFDWDYSPYYSQQLAIKEYVEDYLRHRKNPSLLVKFETTRGCPFKCSFCDWGGGIGTKMIFKNVDRVKADLDTLADLHIPGIYMIDSNYGSGGDRDVEIVNYIIEKKKLSGGMAFQSLHFAGFAKIEAKFSVITKILKTCAKNELVAYYKVSQQSFHDEVLKNVHRVDVSAEDKINLALYLQKKYKLSASAEIVLGLPGMTVDLWFQEFDKPYDANLLVTAYEQFVSPEAETYSREYREKWNLQTTKYIHPTKKFEMFEFVAGHKDCSRADYQYILRIYMCYFFIVQTGIYRQTIKDILKKNNWKFSVFLKKFCEECYPRLKLMRSDSFNSFEKQLEESTQEVIISEEFTSHVLWDNVHVKYWGFLIMEMFRYHDVLLPVFKDWLIEIGGDISLINVETLLVTSENNNQKKSINWIYNIDYKKYNSANDLIPIIDEAYAIGYGNLLTVKKQFNPLHNLTSFSSKYL